MQKPLFSWLLFSGIDAKEDLFFFSLLTVASQVFFYALHITEISSWANTSFDTFFMESVAFSIFTSVIFFMPSVFYERNACI